MLKHKLLHFTLTAAVLLGATAISSAADGDSVSASNTSITEETMKYKGRDREYLLFIPENLVPGKPLVIMLHGYGRHAEPERFGMLQAAAKYGFALCCPQGERSEKAKPGWNVGYPAQEGIKTNDVDFICKLAKHIVKKHGLARENIFLAGHSNGGDMCYLTVYQRPGVFKAYASLAGLTLEWMLREHDTSMPAPFMEVHGTADKTSKWAGDPQNKGGWGEYIAVPIAVGNMVAMNKCTHEETETIPSKSGKTIILHKYLNGTDGCEVWLYELQDVKHSWSEDVMDTGAEIWKFFSRYISVAE